MKYASVFKPGLFSNKTIIVTGGGSGIGRCTAHELAALGAHIALVGRKPEKLISVSNEIQNDGGSSSVYCCDIREEEIVKETITSIIHDQGVIHGLVNNAGGQFPVPLSMLNKKGWQAVLDTNLTGGFLMARETFTQSMSHHGGTIVNIIADMWGGMPMMGHSGAARAGMDNFTKTAAVEWACAGVRVNAIAPGWIASSGMNTYPEAMADHIRNLKTGVPVQRMGLEDEISAAITFLLSPAAAFITGATLRIDGGASLGNTTAFPLPKHNNSQPYRGFHHGALPVMLADQFE